MAAINPARRANYEPNSWPAEIGGPRENPVEGFTSFPEPEAGPKRRLRAESFADHYSQARQFYISQTEIERRHIGDAFVFELSKVERPEIRTRLLAGLRNVHHDLAIHVARGLGIDKMPAALTPARKPVTDLPESPALSIIANPPPSFAGRKIGVLVTDGSDATVLREIQAAAADAKVNVEFVAPVIAGVVASDGERVAADQTIEGGPSVLYDAVVLVPSSDGAALLAQHPAARDFVTDAFAHRKFIGYVPEAMALFEATGLSQMIDEGFIKLNGGGRSAAEFLAGCDQIRFWEREEALAAT